MRVGLGVDAHRFDPERKLVLGGVDIPFDKGLSGHSDADVVLHALMDALLGASGAGDIGGMFPDEDPAYRDASSMGLLEKVVGVVTGNGYRIVNVDIVVICEEPRVAPYSERMRERIAATCEIDKESVSIKGTTTEGMGFTGRGEGVASIAAVLLEEGMSPTGTGEGP
jgi:2-C-methyl-D-erythritol 2,4-cyclodiphosphate synthase